jgi:hypothetical protein
MIHSIINDNSIECLFKKYISKKETNNEVASKA